MSSLKSSNMAMNVSFVLICLVVLSNSPPHLAAARLLAEKGQETTAKQGDKETTPTTGQPSKNSDQASDPKNLGDVKTIPPFTNIPRIPMPTSDQSNKNSDQARDPMNLHDVKTIPPFTDIPGIPFPSIPGGFPFPTIPGGIPFPTVPGSGLPFPTIPGGLPFPTPLPDIPGLDNPFDNVIPGVPLPPLPNIPFGFLSPPPA